MSTVKAIIIREASGDYRKGDMLQGDAMAAFLKTNPNPDYYFTTRVEVEQPELPPNAAPVGKTTVKG